jgi:hypothetical protein
MNKFTISALISVLTMILSTAGIIVLAIIISKHKNPEAYHLVLNKVEPYGESHQFCSDNGTIFMKYDGFSQGAYNCSEYHCEFPNSMGCGTLDKFAVNCMEITILNLNTTKTEKVRFNECYTEINWSALGFYYESRSMEIMYYMLLSVPTTVFFLSLIIFVTSVYKIFILKRYVKL